MELIKTVLIKGGTFQMGGNKYDDEKPVHEVTVPDFYLGQYQVTQALWKAVMEDKNPSHFQGDDLPVETVSWDDAQAFIQKLNEITTGNRPEGCLYRLPSEAEWEFAARGGRQNKGCQYSGSNTLDEVGWYDSNSNNQTQPVGQKAPNELGLYDMSGNVWEWCEDDWHINYEDAPNNGDAWVNRKRVDYRVLRGGSWEDVSRFCHTAYRFFENPGHRYFLLGFRLALSLTV